MGLFRRRSTTTDEPTVHEYGHVREPHRCQNCRYPTSIRCFTCRQAVLCSACVELHATPLRFVERDLEPLQQPAPRSVVNGEQVAIDTLQASGGAFAASLSKLWHGRHHGSGGLRVFSCDHCLRIWEERRS